MKSIIIRRIVLSFMVMFFLFPNFVFAQLSPEDLVKKQDSIELNKEDSKLILDSLKQYFFDKKNNLPELKEGAVLTILYESIKINTLRYILYDVGGDVLKETLEIAYLLLAQDPKLFIEKFEDYTVDKAKEYAMEWLLQKEIKVSKGSLGYSYPALVGGWEAGKFPYVIVYRPIEKDKGEVVIEIYSSTSIKAPDPRMGMQLEGGIEILEPFIVKIKGEVFKGKYSYFWTKGPEIKVVFDEDVPEFEFKEPSVWNKVEASFNKVKKITEKIFGAGASGIDVIIETGKDVWNFFKDLFSKDDLYGASILPKNASLLLQTEEQEVEENIEKETEPEIRKPAFVLSFAEAMAGKQEILDDIAERIDILAQQIASLLPDDRNYELGIIENGNYELGIVNYEYEDEDEDEDDDENFKEEEQEVTKPLLTEDDSSTLVVARRSGGGGGVSTPEPSYCSLANLEEPVRDKIAFDEIGWMGTDISSSDEWIKLKNITGELVDLSNWQVLDKDSQIKVILVGQINDFYLLERTDDTSVPDITADIIYTGALNNTNEAIYLFDNKCVLQDKVVADPDWLTDEPESIPILDTTTPSNQDVVNQAIIINEIAWMGTKASVSDEWIELYNPSEESIDLLGWQLIFQSLNGDPKITEFSILDTTTPIIDGLSYFLLERTNDEAVSDIGANHIFTGALNNDGGVFELRNSSGDLIDKVDFFQGWFAGDNDRKISMERDGDTWRNNNLVIHNGKDADGNDIWGTPRAENSVVQETLIIGSSPFPYSEFDEITLGIQSGKYIIRLDVNIPENKTLVVDPGVVLNFYDKYSGLIMDGTLKAIGEEDNKIVFTALSENPIPGSWDKLSFKPTSVGSELSNIIIEYAGGGYGTPCSPEMAGIKVDQTSISLTDSIIRNNQYNGMKLIDSSSNIDNVQFINNKACEGSVASYGGNGIAVVGGDPVIKNSLFKQSKNGIAISENSLASIKNNTFEENTNAMYLTGSSLYSNGSIVLNNEVDGVMVMGNFPENTTWQADLPYIVRSNISFFPNKVITLEPGVIIRFYDEYSGFIIPGTLEAIGTESDKITFTSLRDEPAPGDWGKISLKPGSVTELDNIILEYGGGMFNWPGIEVDQAELSLKNSIVRFNKNAGVSLINNATAIFDGVQFNDNKCDISEDDKCLNP